MDFRQNFKVEVEKKFKNELHHYLKNGGSNYLRKLLNRMLSFPIHKLRY